jgi:hypothetical protein
MAWFTRVLSGAVLFCVLSGTASAQQALDRTGFEAACLANGTMLTGPLPPEVDTANVLGPLCGCISGQMAGLPQADVDMLTKDLRGEATDVDHAAYGDYDGLVARAGAIVTACFSDPQLLGAPTPQ